MSADEVFERYFPSVTGRLTLREWRKSKPGVEPITRSTLPNQPRLLSPTDSFDEKDTDDDDGEGSNATRRAAVTRW